MWLCRCHFVVYYPLSKYYLIAVTRPHEKTIITTTRYDSALQCIPAYWWCERSWLCMQSALQDCVVLCGRGNCLFVRSCDRGIGVFATSHSFCSHLTHLTSHNEIENGIRVPFPARTLPTWLPPSSPLGSPTSLSRFENLVEPETSSFLTEGHKYQCIIIQFVLVFIPKRTDYTLVLRHWYLSVLSNHHRASSIAGLYMVMR